MSVFTLRGEVFFKASHYIGITFLCKESGASAQGNTYAWPPECRTRKPPGKFQL